MGFIIALEKYTDESGVSEIRIPDGITKILINAIPEGITSVAIPKSVTEIRRDAFMACRDLLTITVDPENPAYCDIDGVLYSKDKTVLVHYPRGRKETEFVVPDHVTQIGTDAFAFCYRLKSVRIPHSVTVIDMDTFWRCHDLTSIVIPDSVTEIADDAFRGCHRLTILTTEGSFADHFAQRGDIRVSYILDELTDPDITELMLPDSVTEIDNHTLPFNQNLTRVTIPAGVSKIWINAFDNCLGLTSIKVDPGNPYFCDVDGILYSKDKSALIRCPRGRGEREFTVPEFVRTIGESAFSECQFLESVVIPDTVTEIQGYAFVGCERLSSLSLSRGVTELNSMVFAKCPGLTHVVVPDGVTSIGNYAFRRCENLVSLSLPRSVTRIAGDPLPAFFGCPRLTVTAPEGSYAAEYAKTEGIPCQILEE